MHSLKSALAQATEQVKASTTPTQQPTQQRPQPTQAKRISLPALTLGNWTDGLLGAIGAAAIVGIAGYAVPTLKPEISVPIYLSTAFIVAHALRLAKEWPNPNRLTVIGSALSLGWFLDAWGWVSVQMYALSVLGLVTCCWVANDLFFDGDGKIHWASRIALGCGVAIALHLLAVSVSVGSQ